MNNYWNPNMYVPQMGQQSLNNIITVNGMQGANAYSMGANQKTVLFDENNDYFYMKSTDGAGFATTRVFKFEEVFENKEGFVTIEEYNRGMNELKEMINNGFESIRKQSGTSVESQG